MNYKSSAPKAWELIIEPVMRAYILNNKVNRLLDFHERTGNPKLGNKAYSKALVLQKKSNKLLGISRQCLSSKGEIAIAFSPVFFGYLLMDFKKYLEKRLMMKELQLMKAEDKDDNTRYL